LGGLSGGIGVILEFESCSRVIINETRIIDGNTKLGTSC